jgi:hypothetical protein
LRIVIPNQSQPGFMHQRRGLERMALRFVGHFVRGQPAELFVNQGQQFVSGNRIALLGRLEDARDVAHPSTIDEERRPTTLNESRLAQAEKTIARGRGHDDELVCAVIGHGFRRCHPVGRVEAGVLLQGKSR